MLNMFLRGNTAPLFFTLCLLMTASLMADDKLLERGRRLYISNCISCHNKDPKIKGAIGPEVIDAPLEVMTAKILTGKYPEPLPAGFVPKRKTKAMRKIPKLEKDIPAIYAWIQSMKKK